MNNPEDKSVRNMLVIGFVAVTVAFVLIMVRNISDARCGNAGKECRYDLEALKKTDTSLLLETGIKFVKPSITGITALAVDCNDNVYVGGRTAVEILDVSGGRVGGFNVNFPVRCLAVSPYGEILAGIKDHIEVYLKNGTRKSVWKAPCYNALLTSVAASSNCVYAADCKNRIVWLFSVSGELLGRIGDRDNDQRKVGFIVPSAFFDVALASDGSLWVANPGCHRLEHFTAGGKFISYWGRSGLDAEGFCGCCNPSNFALLPDGSFVTSEKHIVRVKVYDSAGKFKGIVSGQEEWGKKAVGLDIAVDSKGRIMVLDPQAGVVRVYSGR